MTDQGAFVCVAIVMFATGHWIAGGVSLVLVAVSGFRIR